MRRKLFLFLIIMLFTILVGCDNGENNIESKKELAIDLFLNDTMEVGDDQEIVVNVYNGSIDDLVLDVDNNSVLKIEEDYLYALNEGIATVTATIGEKSVSVTITVNEKVVNVRYELNGGEMNEELPKTRTSKDVIQLPTPTKYGYDFVGWYGDAQLSNKVVTLNKKNMDVTTIYAKWEVRTYQVIYHYFDSNNKETITKEVVNYVDDYTTKNQDVKTDYLFTGWYKEDSLIHLVNKIDGGKNEVRELNLYGKEIAKSNTVSVQLIYNGGNEIYKTKQEIINDFLKDYNYINKKTYTSIAQIGTSASTPLTFHTFYNGKNEEGIAMNVKWKWLATYIYDCSVAQLSSDNINVIAMKSLLSSKFEDTDNNKKGVSTSFRAFLNEMEIGSKTTATVDFSIYENKTFFWSYLSNQCNKTETISVVNPTLPTLYQENYEFDGWYRDVECTQKVTSNVYTDGPLYAYFLENKPVTKVTINNKPEELIKFDTMQLEWTISPADANIRTVTMKSSDPEIASIDEEGNIIAHKIGTVTIQVFTDSQTKNYDEFTVQVCTPSYFNVNIDSSVVTVGETLQLDAVCKTKEGDKTKFTYMSFDNTVAKVDNKGVVTGLKSGYTKIRVMATGTANFFDFGITVLDKNASDIVKFIASCNNAQVYTCYNLGIGDGIPVYYADIYGSVNKLLFNDPLVINTSLEADSMADPEHGGLKSSIEFICIHYTGNMNKGAGAYSNAKYLAGQNANVSIHYCTGNDGVYSGVDDNYVAYHAGDGNDVPFEWYPTGVKVEEGDPEFPEWDISENSYYMLNGKETTVPVPEGKTPETKKVTSKYYTYSGKQFRCLNTLTMPFTIKNGEYYIGTTYWGYNNISSGILCSRGGNLNSIGIEAAVDYGSDLWYTWQKTAQLVGKLMADNKLDVTRITGNHSYSGKDCPQPFLENDCELWWEFIELCRAEQTLLEKYSNYEITMELIDNPSNVTKMGRITSQKANTTQLITYTVHIKNKTTGISESITLGSILESIYENNNI